MHKIHVSILQKETFHKEENYNQMKCLPADTVRSGNFPLCGDTY